VVVKPSPMRLRRRARLLRPRVAVLLAGIAVLPTQSGSISLLPPRLQQRAINGLSNGSLLPPLPPYGNFVPPSGLPDPSLSFAFSRRSTGVPQTWGSDPGMATLLDFNLSVDDGDFGVGGGSPDATPLIASSVPEGIEVVCEQTSQELQAGREFWNTEAGSGPPVDLPLREFAPNSLADPARGPSGDPSNLTQPGPVGAWCRARPLPFAASSPLASRVFWTPVAFVLFVITVFWLSRGFRLPR
jgi:hypothetical protein